MTQSPTIDGVLIPWGARLFYPGNRDVKAAKEYRRMLDTLGGEVRAHLRLAAEALALLPPVRHRGKERA
jgi:hypothetical protein